MYYYVLDERKTIISSIVLDGETDPSLFGAVADERVFAIGDTWTAPVSELERLRADVDFIAAMQGVEL